MKKNITILLALTLFTGAAFADVVYVTARPTPSGGGANPDGTYFEPTITLGDVGAFGSAIGAPPRSGCRGYLSGTDLTNTSAGIAIFPTLAMPGAVYQIDHNFSSTAGNVNTNVILSLSTTNGTLSATNTDKFKASFGTPNNQWSFIGYITNDPGSATPWIELKYESGLVNATAQRRLLFDCFRFTLFEPCLTVAIPGVTGPLAENLPDVTVIGVSASATNVSVYQDSGGGMVKIGEKTAGITAGNNLVPTTGLLKGALVSATQTIDGQESCVQTSGILVGGGANPRVRIVYTIRETTSEGPVGAPGISTSANLHFLGASFRIGSAPGDGPVLSPSAQWQSVTLTRGPDPAMPTNTSIQWNGTAIGDINDLQGQWGILESINFAIDDLTDTGPYDLYIDNLQNGSTVFQTFEGAAAGTQDFGFRSPSFSGTTSGNILSAPNQSIVSDGAAETGTKSLRVRFQWNGTADTKWLRLTTSGVTGTPNPQLNLDDPTTIRFLLLPVGSTPVPNIGISLSGTMATLTWAGTSFTLQCTTTLTPDGMTGMIPWADVPGSVTSPYTYDTSSGPQKFFRLRK